MNEVIIAGKIIREKRLDKVTYCTICVRTGKEYEYITVVVFNTQFYNKYFYTGKWILIRGHLHINQKENTYETEIIADDLNFIGEPSETDVYVNEFYAEHPEIQ